MKTIFSLIGLLAIASNARAEFAVDYREKQDAKLELVGACDAAILTTISCQLDADVYTTSFTIPKEYINGANNRLTVEGDFKGVGGKFQIDIGGQSFALDDQASFRIPSGSQGRLDVRISAIKPGKHRLPIVHWAALKSLTLELDGRNYVSDLLGSLDGKYQSTQKAKKAYRKYKSYLGWFALAPSQLGLLKEELTGRDANDFSQDCSKNGSGESDPLDDEPCQRLLLLNSIMQGTADDKIVSSDRDEAFQDLLESVADYQSTVTSVVNAGNQVDEKYAQQLGELVTWIEKERSGDNDKEAALAASSN